MSNIAPINNRYGIRQSESPYQQKAREQALLFLAAVNKRRRNR